MLDFEEKSKAYDWPELGHDAEMESLAWHSRQGKELRNDGPSLSATRKLVSEICNLLQPVMVEIPEDFLQFSHYERIVRNNINWNSSPGFPYYYNFANNGQFFSVKEGVVDDKRLLEVWPLVQQRINERTCDPIRLFVKQEAHKLSKIRDKRWRLISSVSIIDQIIDQLLFADQNQAIVDSWMYTPLKVGWTPFLGGWRMVPKTGVVALDKSSWDWTVKEWMCEIDLMIRTNLVYGKHKDKWLELAAFRYKSLFNKPYYVTSGGLVLQARYNGVMKSGCVNTITSNSIMQLILHHRVCYEIGVKPGRIWTLGDDTLQEIVPNMEQYVDKMNEYCIVKQVVYKPEFAGFDFGNTIEPLYKGKHAYNLLYADPAIVEDLSRSYQLLYWKSKDKQRLQQVFGYVPLDFDGIWNGY